MKIFEITYQRGDESLTYRGHSLKAALEFAEKTGVSPLILNISDDENEAENGSF